MVPWGSRSDTHIHTHYSNTLSNGKATRRSNIFTVETQETSRCDTHISYKQDRGWCDPGLKVPGTFHVQFTAEQETSFSFCIVMSRQITTKEGVFSIFYPLTGTVTNKGGGIFVQSTQVQQDTTCHRVKPLHPRLVVDNGNCSKLYLKLCLTDPWHSYFVPLIDVF